MTTATAAARVAGASALTGLQAVCLCAAWCRTCDAFAPLFAGIGAPWRVRWIDIEDEAALIGDLDVETFPTLLLFDAAAIRFAGPVRPDATTLAAVLRAAQPGPALVASAPLAALIERLRDDARPCCVP